MRSEEKCKQVFQLPETDSNEEVTDQDLEKINLYARRALTKEEVYCFNLILCDNEIDRDGECFTVHALEQLAELFLGKTGIFDHDPKGEKQSARVFETQVVHCPEKQNGLGEEYVYLKARAYMMRSERNQDLILEIDGGIKKEVSVGCSVQSVTCSICGADRKGEGCGHFPGTVYGGKMCCTLLDCPDDAYEWSFVAIPAQRNAGVVKMYERNSQNNKCDFSLKNRMTEAGVVLTRSEAEQLEQKIASLEQQAHLGQEYLDMLREKAVRLAFLGGNDMEYRVLKKVVDKLPVEELQEYVNYYEKKWKGSGRGEPQLVIPAENKESNMQMQNFKVK